MESQAFAPQKLYTKHFGELEVVCSWCEPPNHIALLSNGSYAHITGLPVGDTKVLRKTLPIEALQAALDWFEHRHDNTGPEAMRILIEPSGSFAFEDGSPITSLSQLTQALRPGPLLDVAIAWFTTMKAEEKAAASQNKYPARESVKAKPQGAAKKTARKQAKAATA